MQCENVKQIKQDDCETNIYISRIIVTIGLNIVIEYRTVIFQEHSPERRYTRIFRTKTTQTLFVAFETTWFRMYNTLACKDSRHLYIIITSSKLV